MKKIALVSKSLAHYRLAVYNELSLNYEHKYVIVGDYNGRKGIKTIPWYYSKMKPQDGGINWLYSKSFYYKKNLQFWQTNVVSKIFSKQYEFFIFDSAASSHLTNWIFSALCRVKGKKHIFWSHGLKGTDKGIKKIIRSFFFKYLPQGQVIYSNFSKDVMIKAGFDPIKIAVIGNSLNYDEQKKIRQKLLNESYQLKQLKQKLFKEDNKTLIFIGRIVLEKKIDKILQLLKDLNQEGIKLNCIIIGEGPERKHLTDLVYKYQLHSQVYFANALYDEEKIAKLFLISDLMLSPGNVGLNCMHSLAYGVPVITHDNFCFQGPEVEAIVPDKNGLLYRYNNYIDMTEKIKLWFSIERSNIFSHCIAPIEKIYNPQVHAKKIDEAVRKFAKM